MTGHFHDRRATLCASQGDCWSTFVVDRIDTVDGVPQPGGLGADDPPVDAAQPVGGIDGEVAVPGGVGGVFGALDVGAAELVQEGRNGWVVPVGLSLGIVAVMSKNEILLIVVGGVFEHVDERDRADVVPLHQISGRAGASGLSDQFFGDLPQPARASRTGVVLILAAMNLASIERNRAT